ncbi:MAG: hypothetical protein AAFV59_16410, partial [Pseudomonadota bacterium]
IEIDFVDGAARGEDVQVGPFAKALKHGRMRDEAGRVLVAQQTPAWVYLPAPLNPVSSTALREEMA